MGLGPLPEGGGDVELRQQVDVDLLPRQPEGGDLQDGRAGEAAMGEQHGLLETGAILGGHRHRQADPGQIGEGLFICLMQGEGHQPGTGR